MNGFTFTGSFIILSWLWLAMGQIGNIGEQFALALPGIAVTVVILVLLALLALRDRKEKAAEAEGHSQPAYEAVRVNPPSRS